LGNYFELPQNNNWLIWDKLNLICLFLKLKWLGVLLKKNIRIFKRLSTLPDEDGIKRHPTKKPIKLYQWVLNKYAKQGDKILIHI
jgi:site-specific DNA-methyltransferase (adenine-specific)